MAPNRDNDSTLLSYASGPYSNMARGQTTRLLHIAVVGRSPATRTREKVDEATHRDSEAVLIRWSSGTAGQSPQTVRT